MLVQNSVYRNTYLTDGVNKDFYFSFPILESSQVLVQTSLLTSTDVTTTVDPSQYTVTGVGLTTGGHISFTTAPPTGSRIALTLNIPITQLYQYAELDSFPAKSHEDALAKLTLICQQLKEQISRSVKVSVSGQEKPEDVVQNIYSARDNAAASASEASAQATAAQSSATAAANSAATAEQTVQAATAEAVAEATAQAHTAATSASAAAQSAADAAAASSGLAPRMDAVEAVTGPATALKNGVGRPDNTTITIDASGKYTATTRPFILGEFYYFRHPSLRTGFAPCQGGILANAVTQYPEIWAYLQTAEGQLLLKTEAQWQAMTTATWATLADGTTVGWGGIGGAPFYVQDLATGTLRMPDLRGMHSEAAGFDSLGVGGVHGDMIRNIVGTHLVDIDGNTTGACAQGAQVNSTHWYGAGTGYNRYTLTISAARVVPTGAANKPRAWGALACCYLGTPAV